MDGELRIDPVVARRGAEYLREAGHALARSRTNLGGDLEDEGAARPWGTDSFGQAFQTNYDQIAPDVLKTWSSLVTHLDEYAAGVTAAIDATVAAEDAARQRLVW